MKTLILALGNPILSDDRVGWEIADRLAKRLPADSFDVLKESGATFDLIRRISEYDRLIVIDAIQLGNTPVGTLHRFTLKDLQSTIHYSSAHDINFATAFEMGRQMGYRIPSDIRIYGVEVKELRQFSENLTPEVERGLDSITDTICRDLSISAPI
jgi:hydrogenase maturation protease